MKVLAIESTCDETAVAVVESFGQGVRVTKNIVASSVEMHEKYGGIVPEVAAREQVKSIIPVITETVQGEEIDAVAVSYGPGLMGSLLIGVETAKVLAWAWQKPLLKVNHMAAHVLANWIIAESDTNPSPAPSLDRAGSFCGDVGVPEMPAVGLVVSGGHTDLILLETLTKWTWIGGTRDDAVGEAFDKTARLLGLPYPGGPEVDKAAGQITDEEWKINKNKFKLPRPLLHNGSLEMSFSGIKAAVARMVGNRLQMTDDRLQMTDDRLQMTDDRSQMTDDRLQMIEDRSQMIEDSFRNMVAREFSEAVVEVLVKKTMKAVEIYQPKSVILAGGVAANRKLRESLKTEVEKSGVKFFVPELKYCGDNAAMVGAAAIMRPEESKTDLRPEPSLGVV